MKCLTFLLALLFLSILAVPASMTITPWMPLYKGVDHAIGTNFPDAVNSTLQVVHCVRVNLQDPDVALFTTPRAPAYQPQSRETLNASITTFIKTYGVQVAINANFYNVFPGGSDPSSEGLPSEIYGLSISRGQVVSAMDTGPDSNNRTAALMFTTNKTPVIVHHNTLPGTNTDGIYTAISGFYPVVSNGVNVGSWAVTAYPDNTIHGLQPRSLAGVSQDRRYLFMITIDGRQSGYSDGSTDTQSADWALALGAWDVMNMDGGGSTALYMADCAGNGVAINHSSLIASRGHERYIGGHFGVFAKPLSDQINDVRIITADTTANLTWTTTTPTAGWIDYGSSSSYSKSTVSNATLVTKHVATLTGLVANATYYYRINAQRPNGLSSASCSFVTSNVVIGTSSLLFNQTKPWKYYWTSLDGVNWTAPGYDDSAWAGPGAGALYIVAIAPSPGYDSVPYIAPRTTLLPSDAGNVDTNGHARPYPTYYFRTHFTMTNAIANTSLTFSNNIDDGAVFYLNGKELNRVRVTNPGPLYTTLASGPPCTTMAAPCTGNACTNCPDVFTIPASALTNLVQGDNLLAVEVHNYNTLSGDIVFGSALYVNGAPPSPQLNLLTSEGTLNLWWNGSGYKLQRATRFGPSGGDWIDVPGPVTSSPYTIANFPSTTFYRLAN
jgi:exopolysaccharide biosynthesis protein